MHWLDAIVGSGRTTIGGTLNLAQWDTAWRPMIKSFVASTARIAQAGDGSHVWMKYTKKEEQCDENLMQSGISGINWKNGHIYVYQFQFHTDWCAQRF